MLHKLVKNNKHSLNYNKNADSLKNYIISLNSEEKKIFINLRDMVRAAIDQYGLDYINTKFLLAKLNLFMDTAEIDKLELAKLGGVLKKRRTNKHRTNKHRTNKKKQN